MRVQDLDLRDVEPIPEFAYRWPDGKTVEQFDTGWRATAQVAGKRHEIKHGLTHRLTYGSLRRRATTWVGPTMVQGVAADDYATSRGLVSLLRRNNKVVTDRSQLGRAYDGFVVVRYADEVAKDRASTYSGLGVKIPEDDVRRWAFHVLIRLGVIDPEWPKPEELTDPDVVRRYFDGPFRLTLAPGGSYASWHEHHVAFMTDLAASESRATVAVAQQEQLWDDNPLGSVGATKSTHQFAKRPKFAEFSRVASRLVAADLPADDAARVAELRRRHDELVSASLSLLGFTVKPRAKVLRFLATFHPQDISCIFSSGMRKVARALTGAPAAHHPIDQQFSIMRALDRALGPPPADVERLAARTKFPWWLWENVIAPVNAESEDSEDGDADEIDEGTPLTEVDVLSVRDAPWTPPSLEELLARFAQVPLVFPTDLVARLHLALHTHEHKHFALLAGLSGTGKTQLARVYANLMHGLDPQASNPWLHIEPVQPDWTDPSALLGYANPLRERVTYQRTAFLNFLLSVPDDGRPRFLVLDEMNLARPEHYFAPFLSAMETSEPLVIHAQPGAVDLVPAEIAWPRDLFIIGTVNMDETTHVFSDKVLDRAFTIELWDVDLTTFREKVRGISAAVADPAFEVFSALQAELMPLRAHVGYRNLEEVLRFLELNAQETGSGLSATDALDLALMMKVLPRLRGEDSTRLRAGFGNVQRICEQHGLDRCAGRVAKMLDELVATGTTRFWS